MYVGSRLKRAWKSGRRHLKSLPSSRTGENPPYGMIGGVEETSASFEARSAPRSYPTNYAETVVKGLPAHERLDVKTDPMQPGYYVEPPDLFQFAELYMRRFPENDPQGKSLAAQTGPAP